MSEIVLGILLIGSAFFIGYPFLGSRRTRVLRDTTDGGLGELEAKKLSLIAEIKEIEFDFQMGKLSVEDYQAISERYRAEAVAVIRRIERFKNAQRNEEIEDEIRRRRANRHSAKTVRE